MMKIQRGSDGCGRRPQLINFVLLGLVVAGCFLPQQAGAQPKDITSFVACVNMVIAANGSVADAAASCVPSSGCYYTNTMSEESLQPACTLRDGTMLPRVIFSCPGPGGNQILRFRPSFSLCSSVINHIELGEDQPVVIDEDHPMKAGDLSVPSKTVFKYYSDFGSPGTNPVVDTTTHRVCTDCHDHLGTTPGAIGVNLLRPIPPELKDGTISTNDPTVQEPANPVSLNLICNGILNSSQLGKNKNREKLAYELCTALLAKEQ